jgi:hypothetical protein
MAGHVGEAGRGEVPADEVRRLSKNRRVSAAQIPHYHVFMGMQQEVFPDAPQTARKTQNWNRGEFPPILFPRLSRRPRFSLLEALPIVLSQHFLLFFRFRFTPGSGEGIQLRGSFDTLGAVEQAFNGQEF